MKNYLRRRFLSSLENRLFWPLAFGALLMVATIIVFTTWYASKLIQQEVIDKGNMASGLIANRINDNYYQVSNTIEELNNKLPYIIADQVALQSAVGTLLQTCPPITGLTIDCQIWNSKGEVINDINYYYCLASDDKLAAYNLIKNVSPANYIVENKPGWKSHYLSSFDSDLNKQDIETFTLLVNQTNNNLTYNGFICVNTLPDWSRDSAAKILAEFDAHGFYLAKNGAVFHITPDNLREKFACDFSTIFNHQLQKDKQFAALIEDMKADGDNIGLINDPVSGEKTWLSYSPLDSVWSIGVFLPDSQLQSYIYRIIFHIAIIGICAILALLFWIKFVARSLTKPLKQLTAASQLVATGDYQQQVNIPNDCSEEIALLGNSFNAMVNQITDHIENEKQAAVARERLDGQLRVAAEIQMSLLPSDYSQIKKIGKVDIFAYLKPAWEMGGDLYSFINIDDRHVFFLIGDVADKGVPAAIYMTRTYSFLKVLQSELMYPATVLGRLNNLLIDGNNSCMFATVFCAVLDCHTGNLRYANAGHVPPILLTATGAVEFIRPHKNCPVGFIADREYNEDIMQLHPNDALFLYTDGVNEAKNPHNQFLGNDSILQALQKCHKLNCSQSLFAMQQFIDDFVDGSAQSDDIAMLMIRYQPKT